MRNSSGLQRSKSLAMGRKLWDRYFQVRMTIRKFELKLFAVCQAKAGTTEFGDTFSGQFGEFVNTVSRVIQSERWVFVAKAHHLVQTFPDSLCQSSTVAPLSPTTSADSGTCSITRADPDNNVISKNDIPMLHHPQPPD